MQNVNQHAANIIGSQPGIAPGMGAAQGISPIVEYLLQMLGMQQQPQKAFKSSEMGRPMPGPQPTSSLRGQMTGKQPTEY